MSKNVNNDQRRPVVAQNIPEHAHDVAAAHHLSEHTKHGHEGAFLETLAADRTAAKTKKENESEKQNPEG